MLDLFKILRLTPVWQDLWVNTLLAGSYFILASFAFHSAEFSGNLIAIWPASGLALAAILVFGYRMVIGAVIGSLCFNLNYLTANQVIFPTALVSSGIISLGTVSSVLLAAYLIKKTFPEIVPESLRNTLLFIAIAILSGILSASFGTIGLALSHITESSQHTTIGFAWWLGDTTGILIVTPLLLTLNNNGTRKGLLFPLIVPCVGLTLTGYFIAHQIESHVLKQKFITAFDDFCKFTDTVGTSQILLSWNILLAGLALTSVLGFYLEGHRREQNLHRENEKRLHRQNQALAQITRNEYINQGDLAATLKLLTEITAKTLFVDRVSVWVFNEERNAIQCIQLYELNDNKHSEGGILSINDYPTYFEALHGNRDIAVDDTYNNPITQEFCQHYLPRFNITSLLDAPIQFGSDFSGIVCHEHVGTKRRWTPDEKNFAGSIADLAALAFEVKKRQGAEAALRASNLELEAKVQARTAELAGLNADLKKEITEHKRTEAILLESELRLRLAINASNIGVWDWNYLDNTINYSSEWKRQLGYEDNEISNQYAEWENRLHPDDKEKAINTNINFINGNFQNTAMEFRLRHKNGSYRWVHSRGQIVDIDDNGKATRILGCHIDITKLKESEEALKAFRWFAESAGQGLVMAMFDGAINYLNPALIKTLDSLGFSLEQRNQLSCFYADESAKILNNEILPKLFSDGQWIGELELGSDKNNRIPTFNNFFAVCNELGKPQYIANIITDISQQKEVELQLRNAKLAAESADRTKSLFIASMSHELRTPLNAIIGFTGILLQGMSGELNERQQDQLNRVSRSAKHLLGLITDIIDLSKIEANRIDAYPETMDLQEVIAQATDSIKSHANEKGLSLDINVPFGITIHTDRKRLLQCVINLLSNAVKYTEKGTVHLTVSSTNTEVLITVKDTGIGIDDKDLERLFIPFERLDSILRINTPGTGLGLYLTQKIARDLLAGKVSVKSEAGVGSCFTLSIRKQLETKGQKNETTACE